MVTSTADCTCNHLSYSRKKLKFLGEVRSSKKYENLAIANITRLGSLKAFLVFEKRNIDTWLYVLLTRHITIWPILKNIKLGGPNQKICRSESMLQPLNYRVSIDVMEKILLNEVTRAKLASWWHVPLIVFVTIWHIRERNWSFWVSWQVLNKYENLAIANITRLGILKAFLVLEKRNIDTWLYMSFWRDI